jgi:hypothetical protein
MAPIETRKGRDDGGYTRLFGDPLPGQLPSRVQSAVIASGTTKEQSTGARLFATRGGPGRLAGDM